jgi:hypothetical protein
LAAGAEHVTLTDIEYLLDAGLLRSAIDYILARRNVLVERIGCDRFDRLCNRENGDLTAILGQLGLTYYVPYRTTMCGDKSIDLIVSHGVLEHIEPKTLNVLATEFKRMLSNDGAMLHVVDNSDHYEQSDKTISRLNFLQFEDWIWKLCCINPQSFTNRLRHSDYVAIFRQHGFKSIFEWREVREKELAELRNMKLAPRFRDYDIHDVAAISSIFLMTKGALW